ncbi:hypothetical protein, partial [Acidiphilium sp.]|uniref:hypothetical protein n=1 Tax=Acidiphilium sp. TaxID=527 RepID=UPI00258D1DA6
SQSSARAISFGAKTKPPNVLSFPLHGCGRAGHRWDGKNEGKGAAQPAQATHLSSLKKSQNSREGVNRGF